VLYYACKVESSKHIQKGKVYTMKKIIVFVVVLVALVFILYGCNTALDKVTVDKAVEACDKAGDVHTTMCTVVAKHDSTATLQDEQGWLWQVDNDDYTVGDSMIAWIADSGTINDTTDDTILYTVPIVQ